LPSAAFFGKIKTFLHVRDMRFFAEILPESHYLFVKLSPKTLYVDFRVSGGINKILLADFSTFCDFLEFRQRKIGFLTNFHGKTRFSKFWKNDVFKI